MDDDVCGEEQWKGMRIAQMQADEVLSKTIPGESGVVRAKVSVQAERVSSETQSRVISGHRGEGNACDLSGSRER